jgi:hydroxyquinol 1,2-dioxygenase
MSADAVDQGGLTSTEAHRRQVTETFGRAADPRMTEVMAAAVRHLHAFVEEVGLTREEWRRGVEFLTAVGQRCDDVRQEFLLLSDTLGVSMLIEMINEQPLPGATEPTVLGPFFVPGSPTRSFGESVVTDPATGGEALLLHGTVSDLQGRPVPEASIDVWQVQPNGLYDIEEDPQKRNLRGVFRTGPDGRYEIRTVRPVDYTIPQDGPVGAMLRACGREAWRPAHVHALIKAPGHKPLVTHVFDAASPHLRYDAVFGVRDSIIVSMQDGDCHFDAVLERTS